MKYVPPIFAFLALMLVLALPQHDVQGAADKVGALSVIPLAVTSTPTPMATATAVPAATAIPTVAPDPQLACLRINFEVSGDVAQAGTYEVREVNGRLLASWTAQSGWQDSGWIQPIESSFNAVYVNVFYLPGGSADPVQMAVMNPAPGTQFGWVARGMCHALEVGWP